MNNQEWKELIESKRAEIAEKIIEAWKEMLLVDVCTSMRSGVLLWDDGDVRTFYRDQNSWSEGEHNGTARCIYSTGSQQDDSRSEYDSDEDYIDFMVSEWAPDTDAIIDDYIECLDR